MPNQVVKPKQSRKQRRGKNSSRGPAFTPLLPFVGNKRTRLVFGGYAAGIEGAVGAGLSAIYRLNGPYDPDTATLSQATPGLAAIAQLYRSMRVWSCKISATGSAYHQGTNVGALNVTLLPLAFTPVLPSNPSLWPVQRLARTVPAKPSCMNTNLLVYDFSLSASYQPHVVANCTKEQYSDEADYASLTNGNPVRQIYIALTLSSNSPLQCGFSAYVRLEYEIEFFDPYQLQ